jgi:integrase/recombinase XerD
MKPTVDQIAAAYLRKLSADVRSGERKEKTVDWYRSHLTKITKAEAIEINGDRRQIGTLVADDLRPGHLTELTMTNSIARVIRTLFIWASEQDYVEKDRFSKLAIPPCGERERVLERAEMVRLYKASSKILRKLLFLMRHCMARPGEVRCLVWSQIDLENRRIVLKEFKAKARRKIKARERVIPLDRVAVRFLAAMKSRSQADHLFMDRYGKPWSYNGVRCAMRTARRRAGLDGDEPIVCYHLRHTAATVATENGTPQKVLAEILGHTRIETTERYQHVRSKHLVDVIDQATGRRRTKIA